MVCRPLVHEGLLLPLFLLLQAHYEKCVLILGRTQTVALGLQSPALAMLMGIWDSLLATAGTALSLRQESHSFDDVTQARSSAQK